MNDERDLLLEFLEAKKSRDLQKTLLKDAQKEYDKAEAALIEFLESRSAVSTAKYEGIGHATISKPRLYASCSADNFEALQQHLSDADRLDLIKTTVLPQTLSGYVKELIEGGKEIPEFINYYFKQSIKAF